MSEPVMRPLLSKRLSRTIILLALPLFVVSLGAFYEYARGLLRKEAIHRTQTILGTTEQLVENYLSSIETAARSNVWMFEANFTPDSLPHLTHRLVSLNPSVLSCSVGCEPDVFPEHGGNYSVYSIHDGDTVFTALEPEFEYFHKNWYKKPMQLGRACWINPFSDFNAGLINHHDAVGSYCIPLRPGGNRIEGIISVDFSFEVLRKTILATHHPYPNSYYMLLGPAGGYLIHPDSHLLFKKTIFTANDSIDHPDIIALGRAMTARETGMMHVNLDDETCHVAYMPVSDTGFSLALVCRESDIMADYNHLGFIMVAFVFLGICVIFWITKSVVQRNIRPLNELMEATKRVANGEYDSEIPLTKHADIVGKMQNAFHHMLQMLIARREDIARIDAEIAAESEKLENSLPMAQQASERRKEFIHNVSRQFITPLNVIGGLAHVLQGNIEARHSGVKDESRADGESDIHSISETMKINAVKLHRATLMLYDVSDTGTADVSVYTSADVVACNQLVRERIDFIKTIFRNVNIRLETSLADSFRIITSRLFLERTVSELLYNACKFSDGQHITVRVQENETTVSFIVEDVGPGLPQDIHGSQFEPFSKIGDHTDGLGLGLPLCKRHAVALGGDLVHDAGYQDGCRIILQLPVTK